jgi:hypothetical protein
MGRDLDRTNPLTFPDHPFGAVRRIRDCGDCTGISAGASMTGMRWVSAAMMRLNLPVTLVGLLDAATLQLMCHSSALYPATRSVYDDA